MGTNTEFFFEAKPPFSLVFFLLFANVVSRVSSFVFSPTLLQCHNTLLFTNWLHKRKKAPRTPRS